MNNLDIDRGLHADISNASDHVMKDISKYKHHPSIVRLTQEKFPESDFDLQYISECNMLKIIQDADTSMHGVLIALHALCHIKRIIFHQKSLKITKIFALSF